MEWLLFSLFAVLVLVVMGINAQERWRSIGSRQSRGYRLEMMPSGSNNDTSRLRNHWHPVRRLDDVLRESRDRLTGELARTKLSPDRKAQILDRLATIQYLEDSRPTAEHKERTNDKLSCCALRS